MRKRIALTASVGTVLLSAAALAACPPTGAQSKTHGTLSSCLDLSTVPQISGKIVAAQPLPPAKAITPIDLDDKPYTGPKVGLTKPEPGVRPAPTLGYHWSLD